MANEMKNQLIGFPFGLTYPYVPGAFEFELYLAGAWVKVTEDVRTSVMPNISKGIQGSGPKARAASIGVLKFALDNSTGNSGGLLGYYSPGHANARGGFDLGSKVRFNIYVGSMPYYKFIGRIVDIEPTAGQHGARLVQVTAEDFIGQMARHKLKRVAVQTNQRMDQLMATVVGNMTNAPEATSYATGPETFPYALHVEQDERTTALAVAQKGAQSDYGYVYEKGDGTLVYESRHTRNKNTSVLATVNDTMQDASIVRSSDLIYNEIKAVTYPVEIDTTVTTLATLQQEIQIMQNDSETKTFRYRDPNSGATRVTGTEMVTPVADTDYKMSSASGDNGNDLNGDLDISVTFGANSAEVTFTNNNTANVGYLNYFRLRGKGIYVYDKVEHVEEDATSQSNHGERSLVYDMPYQNDPNVGESFATELEKLYADAADRPEQVVLMSKEDGSHWATIAQAEPGQRLTIAETISGLSDDYFINGYNMTIMPPDIVQAEYFLEIAPPSNYLRLDHATLGKIGTGKLGF